MRIIFTSDIHNHPAIIQRNVLETLYENIFAENPDLIILGGDIGETHINIDLFTQVLELFHKGALILGNHDLWTHPTQLHTSKDLWETILPQICIDKGWFYLESENWTHNGIAVVGSYLHYDYSAADPEGVVINHIRTNFPEWTTDEYYERMKIEVVNDAKFFTGLPRDKVFAQLIGDAFKKRLKAAEDDPTIHTIIVITHVPCMPTQITRKPNEWHWSCATAYFGNLSHVNDILACSKVKYVISGHSHQGNRATVKFNDGHTAKVITLGADYGKPAFEIIDV